jgi:hypothetical protein
LRATTLPIYNNAGGGEKEARIAEKECDLRRVNAIKRFLNLNKLKR